MKFKIIAFILCVVMLLPFITACGKDEDKATPAADSTGDNANAENAPSAEEAAPVVTEAPPTEPPPTEPPTDPIDPNLPYYDYLDAEFARFGFTGGDRIVAETEEEVMSKVFYHKGCSRLELDVSGDGVPFSIGYRFEVTKVPPEADNPFWEIAYETNYDKNKTLKEGDIIAGCVWLRDGGGPNPAQVFFAIKTPTNGWSGEGEISQTLVELEPGKGWQKYYFYGFSACDEDPASTAMFNFMIGFDPHSVDIGGVYVMRYPATPENEKAAYKMP